MSIRLSNQSCQIEMINHNIPLRRAFNLNHSIRVNYCRVNAIRRMHPNRFLQCRLHISTSCSTLMNYYSVDSGADHTHYVGYYNCTDNDGALAAHLDYNIGCIESNEEKKRLNSMWCRCKNVQNKIFLFINWLILEKNKIKQNKKFHEPKSENQKKPKNLLEWLLCGYWIVLNDYY